MLITLWILTILLTVVFLAAGGMKLARPSSALASIGMTFVEDFTGVQVKLIGLAEVLGALGLILPLATRIVPVLNPIASLCLLVLMIGAIATHARRHENATPPIVLAVLLAANTVFGFIALA